MLMLLADGNTPAYVVTGAVVLVILLAVITIIAKLIVVGTPNEMLVISGRRQSDGQGYRVLIGGSTLVIPIIERVRRLSLQNMQVPLEVKAQSGGGTLIPIIVTGVANVKVSSDPAERPNAIERFLDQPHEGLERVAKETLEGGLRAVIGKMTPQEIVEDREKFVRTVMQEVSEDFRKLGLLIDSVVIQNVHDDEEYLESIARKARADVLASARKAEAERASEASIKEAQAGAAARQAKAERDAEAKTVEALSRQRSEQARLSADKAVAEAENALRIRKAELAREAALKEADQQEAEGKAQQARLSATEVAKAIADREVAKAKAEGDAARTLEDGKARARAIELIGQAIQRNPEALRVMLVEMMPAVVQEVSKAVQGVQLGQITVIDSGNGQALASAALGRAKMIAELLASLEGVLGIDLRQVSRNIAQNIGGPAAATNPVAEVIPLKPGAAKKAGPA